MSHYRIYTLFAGDRIARPTQIFTGDNDQEAIQLAKQLLDGRDLEVRQGPASSAGLNRQANGPGHGLVLRGGVATMA